MGVYLLTRSSCNKWRKGMNWLELAEKALEIRKGPTHFKEIAETIKAMNPDLDMPADRIAASISSSISTHIKNQKSKATFRRVKNTKTGKYKQGMYALRNAKPGFKITASEMPNIATSYVGSAGEHAVLSELLYRGFNGSVMTVDEGIDLVASKGGKFFHIQVKTSNQSKTGGIGFLFTIQKKVFIKNDSATTFYVFVIRRVIKNRWINEYAVLPSNQISLFMGQDIIDSSGQTLSINIAIESDNKYTLNRRADISTNINHFDLISRMSPR